MPTTAALGSRAGGFFGNVVSVLGGPGLLIVAIADSSFFTLPEANDVLIVLFSTGKGWGQMAYYVLMTTIGSIIGCTLLYTAGRKGGRPLLAKRFSNKSLEWVEGLLRRYGILSLFVPSLLPPPCPFKVFVLSAGVFGWRMSEFLGVIAVGRLLRYSMWGILAVVYGDRVRAFMQDNLPTVGLVLAGVLLMLLALFLVNFLRQRAAGREL